MKLNPAILKSLDKSVLCWLATCSKNGTPNVSPKEVFCVFKDTYLLIANIASPQSVKNIKENASVAISFVDILVQKGFQLKGTAEIIQKEDTQYFVYEKELLKITKGKFPIQSILKIKIEKSKPILAPSYLLYGLTKKQQIENSLKKYGFDRV